MNNNILEYGDQDERPLSTITRPYSRIYLEHCNNWTVPGHGGEGDDMSPYTPVMVLFLDGHVKGPFLYDDEFEDVRNIPEPLKKVLLDPDGIP